MTIIKIEKEWNNAHASLEGVDYTLPGWAELPEEFAGVWETNKPFVEITAEGGKITGMTPGTEIEPVEPEPGPGPQPGGVTEERVQKLEEENAALKLKLNEITGAIERGLS